MKCPYHDCQKDYNPKWGSQTQIISATENCKIGDGLIIRTQVCRFCERQFHEIYRGKYIIKSGYKDTKIGKLLSAFPSIKTKFESKKIPKEIKEFFHEAERCRSVGSLTGLGACLRKTIYAICDDQGAEGEDYRKKIDNLPIKDKYQALLKQIKFLGDNSTKPGGRDYTMENVDLALEILPILMEELYAKDEKIEDLERVLAKVNSKNSSKKK